ncbi:MAG TPA: hypothetical protein VL625_05855 [Patescibacteria group bacterium]|nr:hypothetical protein [Patescibacteria group bacterium]
MKKLIKRTGLAVAGLCLAAIFGAAAKNTWHMHELRNEDPAGRPLTAGEIALARPIFGETIDYAHTRLHMSPSTTEDARTDGSDVYLEAAGLQHADLSAPGISLNDQQILLHELTHVWRNQNTGALDKVKTLLTESPQVIYNTLAGGHAGYDFTEKLRAGKNFNDMSREEQAELVANYFRARTLAQKFGPVLPQAYPELVYPEVIAAVTIDEKAIGPALPLPGALTFKPVPR